MGETRKAKRRALRQHLTVDCSNNEERAREREREREGTHLMVFWVNVALPHVEERKNER